MASKKKAAKRPAPKKAAAPAKITAKSAKPEMENCCAGSFCGMPCGCPVFGVIATRTFWLALIPAIIVGFAFDFYWHGQLLMPDYLATAAMWRPMEQMEAMFQWCIAYHLALGAALTALVLLMGRTGWWGGFITGVLAMAPVAVCNLGAYMHLPFANPYIPEMWALGALLQGGLVGLMVTAIARCKSCCGALCK